MAQPRPTKPHLGHAPILHLQIDLDAVATERIRVGGGDVGLLEMAVVARLAVVVENVLAVQVVHRH